MSNRIMKFNGTPQLISALAGGDDLVYPGDRPLRNKHGGVDSMGFKRWIDWIQQFYGIDQIKIVQSSYQCPSYFEVDEDRFIKIQGDSQRYLNENPIDAHGVKSAFQTFVLYCLRPTHVKSRYIKWSDNIGQNALTQPFVSLFGAPDSIPTDNGIPTTSSTLIEKVTDNFTPEVTNTLESKMLKLIDYWSKVHEGDEKNTLKSLMAHLKHNLEI